MRKNRNGLTQKQLAEKFNISVTTVKKYTSIDRVIYEQEALNRRKKAYKLRSCGLKYKEIADEMGITLDAVKSLLKRHKQDLKESV
ncbi:sigma factor-like helix-turn-helix DNA-binding protein [Providencia rettgeri]